MSESEKPKINIREIIEDIRSGLDDSSLMRKYRLSERGLQLLYEKLRTTGLLTEEEARARLEIVTEATESETEDSKDSWRCPACRVTQSTPMIECPTCGIIVEKYEARPARQSGPPEPETQPAPKSRKRLIIAACGLGALIIVAGVLWLLPTSPTEKTSNITSAESRSTAPDKFTEDMQTNRGELLELSYSDEGYPLGLSISQSFAFYLFETPSPIREFKKTPPKTGAKRYYGHFKIAGAVYLVIVEESTPPKFYLDSNRNGDFTDDIGPFIGERRRLLPNFYTLELPYPHEKTPVDYRIWLFSSRMGGVRFYPACHWSGALDINGLEYKIVVFDADSDGDYSNDHAVIDVDDDGKAADEEKLKPGETCDVNGTIVELVSIAPSGRAVRLEK
jgi:hypothetical protein